MVDLGVFAELGLNKETALKLLPYISVGGVLGVVGYCAKKVFDLGKIMQRLETVEAGIATARTEMQNNATALRTDIQNSSNGLAKRIDELMIAVASMSTSVSNSPRQLNDNGKKILRDSGIDTIVDDKFDLIVREVGSRHPENAYQAEQAIVDVVRSLTADAAVRDAVEEGAFNSGNLTPVVLYVGAIYIRDRVLKEIGLSPDEIDKHDPQNGN